MKPYYGLLIVLFMFGFAPNQSLSGELKDFRYISDSTQFNQTEYWQSPEEFAERRRGDCEDFAIYAKSILDKQGYQSLVFSVFVPNNSHTVLVFKEGKYLYFLDYDRVRPSCARNFSELASEINKEWEYAGIMRREGNVGIISRRFNNKEQGSQVSIKSILGE